MKYILLQEQNDTHWFLGLCWTGKLTRARTKVQALSHNHGKGFACFPIQCRWQQLLSGNTWAWCGEQQRIGLFLIKTVGKD